MSISSEQYNRIKYLQSLRQQRAQEKEAAKKQAEENWEQYREEHPKANIDEVLANGWQSVENEQQHLSDLYSSINNLKNSWRDVNWIYESLWYDSMSNQEKNIVDWILWWYEVDNNTLF